jgi:hypothetical protein
MERSMLGRASMGPVARCLPIVLAVSLAPACAPVPANAPNSTKLADAAGFAAAAGVIQVAQAIAEEHARNEAPVTHPGGRVSGSCDTSNGQYACVSVSDSTEPERPPETEMTNEQARDYVRDYVNGVRKLNGAPPVIRDARLDVFAQDGSEELAVDHQPGLHLAAHASELSARAVEIQGSPDGGSGGMVQDVLGALLVASMDEAPGGARRERVLGTGWKKVGVGIARMGGRTYVTVDLSE